MHKNMDEIGTAIDGLILRNLELMEDKISTNIQMEMLFRDGCIEMAKARYIGGKQCADLSKIPVNMEDMVSLFELKTTFIENSVNKVPCFDITLKKRDQADDEVQNPIKWFGVLVPRNLWTAQKRFQESVFLATKIANIQCELTSVGAKLKALYLLKNAFSDKSDDNCKRCK